MQRLYDGIKNRGLPVETLHATSLRRCVEYKHLCGVETLHATSLRVLDIMSLWCGDVACNVST